MWWHAYGDRQYTRSRYLLVRSASPSDSWALVLVRFVVLAICWLATLLAISNPYCQAAFLWLCPSVCPQHGLCYRVDIVRAMLQSLQRREPLRLPACFIVATVDSVDFTCYILYFCNQLLLTLLWLEMASCVSCAV